MATIPATLPFTLGAPDPDGPGLDVSGGPVSGQAPADCLLIRLTSPNGDGSDIVRECPPDLQFWATAPGGYDAVTFTIDWPVGWPPSGQIQAAGVCQVIDRRNGSIVWHGQVIDPGGRFSSSTGQHLVAARGFQTVLDTNGGSVAYVDRDLSRWSFGGEFGAGQGQELQGKNLGNHSADWVATTESVLETRIPNGSTGIATPRSYMTWRYVASRYMDSAQDIVYVLGTSAASSADSWYYEVIVLNIDGTVAQTAVSALAGTVTSSADDWHIQQGSGAWTTPAARQVWLQTRWSSTANAVTTGDFWERWGNLAVVFETLDRDGSAVATPGTYLKARDIINDVIGRWLRDELEITSELGQPADVIEQAAWFEGTTPRDVFTFLDGEIADDYWWAVWEPGYTKKPQFVYKPWATRPRFVFDGSNSTLDLAGGADNLFNRAVVAYQGAKEIATVVVTGVVDELDAAGQTRTLIVDLTGEGNLTTATATAKGLRALTQANNEKATGTVTVTGPVLDKRTGRMIEPWELVRAAPGSQCVAGQGVLRSYRGYVFDPGGGRQGSTYRVTEAVFSASTGAAVLTLDGGARSLLSKVRIRRPSRSKRHVKAPRVFQPGSRYTDV